MARFLSLYILCLMALAAIGCRNKENQEGLTRRELGLPPTHVEMTETELYDRIAGGLAAEILGNLNGLPHEFKYFAEPGNVEHYTPSLPEGARTDDDTDIEWVYICEMQRTGELFLPPEAIVGLWKAHINRAIWSANDYARQLIQIGLAPPYTGRIALNPWSVFNISGQFVCESFGLISPAMPQAAATIGTHYTHVTIDGEPSQATQLFTAMIATAFYEKDISRIIETALAAIDPASEHVKIVDDVRSWHALYPEDWRETRRRIKEKYARFGDRDGRETRDGNGYDLNSASTVAALLYGGGDLAETLRTAFNFGWDADNNAATAATIVGVTKGWNWIREQGWEIADVYRNTTRDAMPQDETITGFACRLDDLAVNVILRYGGERIQTSAGPGFRIKVQPAANVEPLPAPLDRGEPLREELRPQFESWLAGTPEEKARAAYIAICLGEAKRLAAEQPAAWRSALACLEGYPALVEKMFSAPAHTGSPIAQRAAAAGLKRPEAGSS